MIDRHPAVLANTASTVDIISGGRLDPALGAGWNQLECDAYGIDLPPLKERFDRFDEGARIALGLLSQEHTDFAGESHTLTRVRCEPKPVQRPHPPLTIGGRGRKRTLLAAARWAQQWIAITGTVEEWSGLKRVLTEHCTAVGGDPTQIECSVHVLVQGDGDLRPALDTVATYREAGADIAILNLPHGAPTSPLEPVASGMLEV